jgi:hypothetical protein
MIDVNSKTLKQKCYIVITINTYKKRSKCSDIQCLIRQAMSTSIIQNSMSFLNIYTKTNNESHVHQKPI